MSFLRQAELLDLIIQEINLIAPEDWRKIVYYAERSRKSDGYLDNAYIAKCWVGDDLQEYNPLSSSPLNSSAELFDAVDSLFEHTENSSQKWSGFGLIIDSEGVFSTKFYYDGVPLLEENNAGYMELFKSLIIQAGFSNDGPSLT